jgi:hypothetical protein
VNFLEAVAELKNGKRIIRPEWKDMYIVLLPGLNHLWIIKPIESGAANWVTTVEEIMAVDYQVI